jgi:hypothetical protein
MAFSLEDIPRRETAGEVLGLSPRRARWTAPQAELIRADAPDRCSWRADPIRSAPLRRRPPQASGGLGRGAVSDAQDLQPPGPPAAVGPVRRAPIVPQGLTIAPAMLLEATDECPPIVAHPLQEPCGGIPGGKESRRGMPRPAMADLAEGGSGQRDLRGATAWPKAPPQRDAPCPGRPIDIVLRIVYKRQCFTTFLC